MDGLVRERERIENQRRDLRDQAADARGQAYRLHMQRESLQRLDEAARRAVTDIDEIKRFWNDVQQVTLVRTSDDVDLLRRLARRLEKTSVGPAFDDPAKQRIRSLRETMLEFGQSVRSNQNFVTLDQSCAPLGP